MRRTNRSKPSAEEMRLYAVSCLQNLGYGGAATIECSSRAITQLHNSQTGPSNQTHFNNHRHEDELNALNTITQLPNGSLLLYEYWSRFYQDSIARKMALEMSKKISDVQRYLNSERRRLYTSSAALKSRHPNAAIILPDEVALQLVEELCEEEREIDNSGLEFTPII